MGMMDVSEKELLLGENGDDDSKKCCVDCKTTKTPLWRGGPAGPKSLCNACGIRFRKRRISMVRMSRGYDRKKERTHSHGTTTTTSSSAATTTSSCGGAAMSDGGDGEDLEGSLKMRLMALGEEVLLHNLPSAVKKQRCQRRRKLGEEEQAAVSLMALSCGSVFA